MKDSWRYFSALWSSCRKLHSSGLLSKCKTGSPRISSFPSYKSEVWSNAASVIMKQQRSSKSRSESFGNFILTLINFRSNQEESRGSESWTHQAGKKSMWAWTIVLIKLSLLPTTSSPRTLTTSSSLLALTTPKSLPLQCRSFLNLCSINNF